MCLHVYILNANKGSLMKISLLGILLLVSTMTHANCISPPPNHDNWWPIQVNNWNWQGKLTVNKSGQIITIINNDNSLIGHFKASSMSSQCINGKGQTIFMLPSIGYGTQVTLERKEGESWKTTVKWNGENYSRTQ